MRSRIGKFTLKVSIKFVFLLVITLAVSGLWADSRDTWQQPEKVMEVIGIKPGMVIGEPGAGNGYFTIKLARKVGPSGKIYANDIVESSLKTIKEPDSLLKVNVCSHYSSRNDSHDISHSNCSPILLNCYCWDCVSHLNFLKSHSLLL